MNIIDIVKNYCLTNELFDKGDKILLAVSGGPDSIALLYIFSSLSQEFNLELSVFHLEHGLRGIESLRDQEFVGNISKKLRINFYTKNVNISYEKRPKESLEQAARRIRYKHLFKTLNDIDYDKIATGHTLDDNIETIIFRLISGTGLTGFSGIRPKNGYILHPLLSVRKDQILHFLKNEKINYKFDATNSDITIIRNKIRQEVIPLLSSINNRTKEHILNFSKIINEEDLSINKLVHRELSSLILEDRNDVIKVDCNKFMELDPPIKRRIIIMIYKRLTKNNFEDRYISYKVLDYLSKYTIKGNKILFLNDLLTIYKEYDLLVFKKKVVGSVNKGYLYSVYRVNNTIKISEIDKKLIFYTKSRISSFKKNKLYFDFEKVGFPLIVRSRSEGDKIYLKDVGFKKVKNIFIDEKVPKVMRDLVPIIQCNNNIIGVFTSIYGKMNRVSEEYMINNHTKKVLVCELI